MSERRPCQNYEDALAVVTALLEADPEDFDLDREVARLTTHTCPACGSTNTSQPDDEKLVDCLDCGIWFNPYHPRNKHALHNERAGTYCQGCGKPFGHDSGMLALDPTNSSDFRWLCGYCNAQARNDPRWWKGNHIRGRKDWHGQDFDRIPESAPDAPHDPHKDPETPDEVMAYIMRHGATRRIKTSFGIVTPESAEQGDFAESGWEDEEGEEIVLDEWDREDGKTLADLAVKWLLNHGAQETSSSHFHPGVWYTAYEENYHNGENKELNFHLEGFSDAEQAEIFQKFKGH